MSEAADLVVLGGSLEPIAAPPAPDRDALAVRGGRIVAIGASADLRALIGPATEVVELSGETVLPGFQDAHIHPIEGGLLADRCDLHALTDADAYVAAIRAYADAHPEREWITGSGWSLPAFPGGEPDRALLDRAVGDRPAILESNDGHVAWVSTRALELAGIDGTTPDPPDGRIARDGDGTATGTLHDGATHLVSRLLPQPSHEDLVRGLLAAQAELHGLGITAWQDAHVEAAELDAYRAASADGRLTARVEAALWWDRTAGLEQIGWLEEARAAASVPGQLRAGSVKLMLDGILESRTAFMTSPYAGHEERGSPFIEPDLLRQAVIELDRRGFWCHFHAIGDAAVRLALDSVEAARAANGRTPGRHHIAHIEVIHPDDIGRFADLDVTANMQPLWAADDDQMRDLRMPVLGEERATWQYPFGSLARAGARLAAGSDWTVSSADPLREIEVAVRRVAPETRDAAAFLPEQRLSLDQALAAFTIGSAFVNHLDTDTGTIEVGKLADLAIIDRDLRAPDTGPIGDAGVRATYVGGRRVA
ncbi:MAG TPA: amidohydrolase [Patescibacteria group bacterium]|nr:amidohydrolase [Patescibacteria group bacterium]